MKILVLSHISELLGGAERSMLEVISHWEKTHGIKPEFILRKPVLSLGPEITKRGWKYHALDYTFWSDSKPPDKPDTIYYQGLNNSRAVLEIEELIEKIKPDIVLTNSVVCPWAAIAAYHKNVPHVWFVREYGDLDHGRDYYLLGREKTYQDVDAMSDLVVANSKTLADYLSKYIEKNKITTLYNPFDIKKLQTQATKSSENPFRYKDSIKLALTGNLARSKGQLDIVKIVGECNRDGVNTELALVGRSNDDDYHKEIRNKVKKDGTDGKVHIVGFKKNPLPIIQQADIGLMMSQMEAFGRVTFEYLALGKPVIGRKSGATTEMVKNGVNGFLFEKENQIKDFIEKYSDNELLKKHGAESLKTAKRMMEGKETVDNVYKEVAKLKGKKKNNTKYLNISKTWLLYPSQSEDHIDYSHTMSLWRILFLRTKRKLKHLYKKVKS